MVPGPNQTMGLAWAQHKIENWSVKLQNKEMVSFSVCIWFPTLAVFWQWGKSKIIVFPQWTQQLKMSHWEHCGSRFFIVRTNKFKEIMVIGWDALLYISHMCICFTYLKKKKIKPRDSTFTSMTLSLTPSPLSPPIWAAPAQEVSRWPRGTNGFN